MTLVSCAVFLHVAETLLPYFDCLFQVDNVKKKCNDNLNGLVTEIRALELVKTVSADDVTSYAPESCSTLRPFFRQDPLLCGGFTSTPRQSTPRPVIIWMEMDHCVRLSP